MNNINLKWTEAAENYKKFCLQAASNLNIFQTFRRNPVFTQIMEHFNQKQGMEYFNVIKKTHPEMLIYLKKFSTSENVGSPLVFKYDEILLSPSTLRYIKVFTDISDCFGSLEGFKIVEIGGGYGGQCKIIKDLYNVDYTFIDLPEVNALAGKYLHRVGVNDVKFYDYKNIVKKQYDLVISNHAFSELNYDIQDYYNKIIIKESKRGFMTCNVFLNENNGYQIDDYEKMGKVNFMDEIPNTHPHNFIVYWNE